MAREFYGYFDSIDADVREYDAAQFAHILRASVQNGVSSHEGGLEVTADGLDMRTSVTCGGCVIEGYVYVLEDDGGEPYVVVLLIAKYERGKVQYTISLDKEGQLVGFYLK